MSSRLSSRRSRNVSYNDKLRTEDDDEDFWAFCSAEYYWNERFQRLMEYPASTPEQVSIISFQNDQQKLTHKGAISHEDG